MPDLKDTLKKFYEVSSKHYSPAYTAGYLESLIVNTLAHRLSPADLALCQTILEKSILNIQQMDQQVDS